MGGKKKAKEPKRNGRPPIEIDADQLRKAALLRLTIEEAAVLFGTVPRTLKRKLAENPELKRAWDEGGQQFKISLKRLQWRHAQMPNSAGVAMTTHLSKHVLGEHDRSLVLNATVAEIDEAIRELEQRSGSSEESTGDEGES